MGLTEKEKGVFSGDGMVMKREYGKTEDGLDLNGRWVLRDVDGGFIDFDAFRYDLVERNDLALINKHGAKLIDPVLFRK